MIRDDVLQRTLCELNKKLGKLSTAHSDMCESEHYKLLCTVSHTLTWVLGNAIESPLKAIENEYGKLDD